MNIDTPIVAGSTSHEDDQLDKLESEWKYRPDSSMK